MYQENKMFTDKAFILLCQIVSVVGFYHSGFRCSMLGPNLVYKAVNARCPIKSIPFVGCLCTLLMDRLKRTFKSKHLNLLSSLRSYLLTSLLAV